MLCVTRGKLAGKTCVDLQEVAAKAALAAGNVDPKMLDSAVIGNVISVSSCHAPAEGHFYLYLKSWAHVAIII